MSERSVVLFNPRDLVLRAARRLGLATVVVIEPDAPAPLDGHADVVLRCGWLSDLDSALDQLAPLAPTCLAAFGFGEIGCAAAAAASERFGWPGNPVASVQAFQDKAELRAAVGDRAGAPVRHRRCQGTDELLAAVEQIGYPCIVKPVAGTGSAGVRYLADPTDFLAYQEQLGADDQLLVEEFLVGTEVSVEAMSCDGQHRLLAVTAKTTTGAPDFVETGHTLPIDLDQPERDQLWQVVQATLTAAGHRFGVTHTEVMLTAAGPRLIESHGRPGGDRISDLIQLATGIDVFFQTIALTLGVDCELAPSRQLVAGIRYLAFDTTLPRPELDLAPVSSLPYVHEVALSAPAGQRPPAVHRSADRHGFVVATGSDPAELAARLDHACAIVYEQAAAAGSPPQPNPRS